MQNTVRGMTAIYAARSGSGPGAVQQAYAAIYGSLQQQAAVLSYRDTILAMAIVTTVVMPLVLLARRPKPGEMRAGH
jgi:hypothetical protein